MHSIAGRKGDPGGVREKALGRSLPERCSRRPATPECAMRLSRILSNEVGSRGDTPRRGRRKNVDY